jgi:type II secretory pathway pseudopilin PulG
MQNKTTGQFQARRAGKSESGVTLLEMVIAMMILTVGLLGLAGAITYALAISNRGRGVTNTKQLVTAMLEQVETLRNAQDLTYGQIANVGSVDDTGGNRSFAGFPTGFMPVSRDPGPDGIFGTADDLIAAGPDGVFGTWDDFTDQSLAFPNYSRQITITFLSNNPNLKKITVTLNYPGPNGRMLQMVGVRYLNNDAHSNYL